MNTQDVKDGTAGETAVDMAATHVIHARTRRERSRTSVIGLLRAIGVEGAFSKEIVDLSASRGGFVPSAKGNAANFESLEVISNSPQGTVMKAYDRNVARTVAMKVLMAPAEAPSEKVLRFVHEAQLTGQREHPNIVPVHEIGVDSAGNVYYVMKYIKGITLQGVIDKIADGDDETIRAFPLSRMLEILTRVCDAVEFAHSHGVIHRDLKPENVMLGDFGEVLVMDWGLGKILSDDDEGRASEAQSWEGPPATVRNVEGDADVFQTMDGVVMGTPAYMAPEQARIDGKSGVCSDVYALGGILYAILTLRPPIQGRTLDEILRAKARGTLTPPVAFNDSATLPHCPSGRIPEALSAVALRALSLSEGDRYGNVESFRRELNRYSRGFSTDAEQAGSVRLAWLMIKRHRERIIAAILLLTVVATVAGISARQVVLANREANAALMRAAGIGDAESRWRVAKVNPSLDSEIEYLRVARGLLEDLNPEARPIRMNFRYVDDKLELDLSNNPMLRDIAVISNLPVHTLFLSNTGVKDLGPLAELSIRRLVLAGTPVESLAYLKGMPLEVLDLNACGAVDLTGVATLPLRRLDLRGSGLVDLGALENHPTLQAVLVPTGLDYTPLRTIKTLKNLSYKRWEQTTESFWAELE